MDFYANKYNHLISALIVFNISVKLHFNLKFAVYLFNKSFSVSRIKTWLMSNCMACISSHYFNMVYYRNNWCHKFHNKELLNKFRQFCSQFQKYCIPGVADIIITYIDLWTCFYYSPWFTTQECKSPPTQLPDCGHSMGWARYTQWCYTGKYSTCNTSVLIF